MKVEMVTTAAGPQGVSRAGERVEVSDKAGRALIERGFARELDRPKPVRRRRPAAAKRETATDETRETAAAGHGGTS